MNITRSMSWLTSLLVLTLVCSFIPTAIAQNYYPAEIGNTWIFLSADGTEQRTYTLEGPENINGQELILLKIARETPGTDAAAIEDKYFITVDSDGELKLHQSAVDQGAFGVAEATYDPPAPFFPAALPIGRKWEIVAEVVLKIVGPTTSASTLEVVAIEDLETPIGTFKDCVKLEITRKVTTALGIQRYNFVQWLAPEVGPVKFLDADQDILFELQSYELVEAPAADDTADDDAADDAADDTADDAAADDTADDADDDAATDDAAAEDTADDAAEEDADDDAVAEDTAVDTTDDDAVAEDTADAAVEEDATTTDDVAPEMPASQMFEITLTNLTEGEPTLGGQILSPPIFAVHPAGVNIAPVGEAAIPALVALAENGDASGLAAIAAGVNADVVAIDAIVPPGGTVTVTVTADMINSSLSVASMLVSTNDGFIAATDVALFDEDGMPVSMDLELIAYDAGSEENTELASDIPGPVGLDPAVDPEGSNARVPSEGGVIAPHEGIQGVGDVGEAFAWAEPTAMLSIMPTEAPVEPEPMPEPEPEPMPEPEPEPEPEPIVSAFDVTLAPGLNMMSVPLMPEEPYTAKSLAEMLGATVVIQFDVGTQSFTGYTVADSGDGFGIEGVRVIL